MTLTINTTVNMRGYVLKAHHVRGQSQPELERRLGYRVGRLVQGWYLLFLTRKPTIHDFTIRGYTHFPDGVPTNGAEPPEPMLLGRGWTQADVDRLKRKTLERTLTTSGPERLAKVIPYIEHTDMETYPPGSGIPQWRLSEKLPFKVKAFIRPGAVYNGDYS